MALLNKRGRLSIDPCILHSAKEVVKFAKDVARKSDHVASDILITAVWCCMNCVCCQGGQTEANVKRPPQTRDAKAQGNKNRQSSNGSNAQDRKASKEKSQENDKADKRSNSTSGFSKTAEVNQTNISKVSKPLMKSKSSDICPNTATNKSKGIGQPSSKHQVNDHPTTGDNISNKPSGPVKNIVIKIVSNEPQKTGSKESGKEQSGKEKSNETLEIVDEVVVLDDNDDDDDVDGDVEKTDDLPPSNVADSETVVEKGEDYKILENDDQDCENDDQEYFDMDCDEIDEDQLSDTEPTSTTDSSKDKTGTNEVMVISDDEQQEESKESSGNNDKKRDNIDKQTNIANKQSKKSNDKPSSVVEKTDIAKCSEKDKETNDKKRADDVEIIDLDSDSETEESSARGAVASKGSVSVKEELGIEDDQVEVSSFSCSVVEELNGMSAVDHGQNTPYNTNTDTTQQHEPDTGNEPLEDHFDIINNEQIGETMTDLPHESEIKVEHTYDTDAMMSLEQGGSVIQPMSDFIASHSESHSPANLSPALQSRDSPIPPGSSEFGPSVIGLVPNSSLRQVEQHTGHQGQTITATTITFFSAGPSWGSVAQDQQMPYMIQSSQPMNPSESPPSKKRLLDFDKKWHTQPKLDRYHDRYLALPGGIEGNSVASFEDRQRKIAAADNDYSTPSVSLENVGDGNDFYHGGYAAPDKEPSNSDDSDSDSNSKAVTTTRSEWRRGRLKSGQSTKSRGSAKSQSTAERKRGQNEDQDSKSVVSRGRTRGHLSRGRGSGGRGKRGRGSNSSSSSQSSPSKSAAAGSNWKKIGFYSVKRGAGGSGPGRGGVARGRGGVTRGGRGVTRGEGSRARGQRGGVSRGQGRGQSASPRVSRRLQTKGNSKPWKKKFD